MIFFKVLLIDDFDADHLAIGERLKHHPKSLKFSRRKALDTDDFGRFNDRVDPYSVEDIQLNFNETKKCEKRAAALVKRRLSSSVLPHLKEDDFERLKAVINVVRMSGTIRQDRADEIAAEVHAEFPWMGRSNEVLWHTMRRAEDRGEHVHLGPLLLNGPAGLGKTAWSSYVSRKLKLPFTSVDVSSGAGQFSLTGLERGWSGAEDRRVIRSILQHRLGKTVIFVDELDKSVDMTSRKGRHLSIEKALLPMLEQKSAPVDMSILCSSI
ncbi:AAA family ATPase [Sulfitobacter sp.]|uniref:AAA family ATPase n=1 Tax=Sulfitobacter sp. TaxID=1903071 RepID=UPI0030029FE7